MSLRVFRLAAFAVLLASAFAAPALAGRILPASYAMPNGHGHTLGGWYNYWDASYSGSTLATTDNAPLVGGLGDLSDGIIPTSNWDEVENDAGTGPYVGWININPTITFHFDGAPFITDVFIHTDDSFGQGGVTPPHAVLINGTEYDVVAPSGGNGAPFAIHVSDLELSGDVSVQLIRNTAWVFISEVQFGGPELQISEVPEPGSMALLAAGLIGLGTTVRKRRALVAAA